MMQNSGPTGSSTRSSSHGDSCSQPQASMPISRRRPPLPWRTSSDPPRIEVSLAQRERLLDAQPGAPEHDDQRAQASAVAIVGSSAHHGDDLPDSRRVSGLELPLVARRATGVVARQGRGRSPPIGGIEGSRDGHGISSQSNSRRTCCSTGAALRSARSRSRCLCLPKAGGSSTRLPTPVRSERLPGSRLIACIVRVSECSPVSRMTAPPGSATSGSYGTPGPHRRHTRRPTAVWPVGPPTRRSRS
jgi:hypothetical protein